VCVCVCVCERERERERERGEKWYYFEVDICGVLKDIGCSLFPFFFFEKKYNIVFWLTFFVGFSKTSKEKLTWSFVYKPVINQSFFCPVSILLYYCSCLILLWTHIHTTHWLYLSLSHTHTHTLKMQTALLISREGRPK